MKIGNIEARRGHKAFGYFKTGETNGRFDVHIPLHIVAGAEEGPVLVVQAGVSGLEIEPATILPRIVADLDPAKLAGTLVMVPLMNTSGFLFEQINAVWDDKDLNSLGRGDANGTISEAMIHAYYEEVLAKADALLDLHTGAQWSYHRYAGVYQTGNVAASKSLAIALGLPQVLIGQPNDNSMAQVLADSGTAVVSAQIGGGPGLRDYRTEDMERIKRAVHNGMRHLGMMADTIEYETDKVDVIEAHSIVKPTGERGFTFIDSSKRGTHLKAGEQLGYVRHPFSGDLLQKITAPRDGVMLYAGASWPVPPEGTILAILGDLAETISKV